jgi:uncharacterized phage protein (TIGR01671 family)
MNRELKFRTWNTKEMTYFTFKDIMGNGRSATTIKNATCVECEERDEHKVMQYTGLKDKNSKEIYEGDILSVDGTPMVVVWDNGNLQWIVKHDLNTPTPFRVGDGTKRDLELWYVIEDGFDSFVIGNLYQTPELLNNK